MHDHLLDRLIVKLNVCFSRIYHRVELRAACPLPRRGPAMLICNHISGLDPLLIQSVSPRVITWMMAGEYYDLPVLGRIFRRFGMIPVDRSRRDLGATRAALRTLSTGGILGIFPEGRIEKRRQILPFQTGPAMMAIKTGVPVYPACIEGTQRGQPMLRALLEPNDATIHFGEPIRFHQTSTSREAIAAATRRFESAVRTLQADLMSEFPKKLLESPKPSGRF